MLQLAFELTNRCDIACLHCLRDKDDVRSDLTKDFILRILGEAKAIGVQTISFTGGEPTLHPDYLELIEAVCAQGFNWITVTNGHNFDLFRAVFESPLRRQKLNLLAISLDGATEEVHDKIRGKGSFNKIMKTATLLLSMGLNVRFQMILNTENLSQMEEFCVLASSLGMKSAYFGYLQPTEKTLATGIQLSPEDHRRAQMKIPRLNQMFNLDVGQTYGYFHPSPMMKCSILHQSSMNIDYLGNMVFCCQLSNYGDISYVPDRQEIVADLQKSTLLAGYQLMIEKVADYNKTKAQRAARGEIKGLDLFPCHYCARQFGKMNWVEGKKANGWEDPAHELPESLQGQEGMGTRSLFPMY